MRRNHKNACEQFTTSKCGKRKISPSWKTLPPKKKKKKKKKPAWAIIKLTHYLNRGGPQLKDKVRYFR